MLKTDSLRHTAWTKDTVTVTEAVYSWRYEKVIKKRQTQWRHFRGAKAQRKPVIRV